MKKLLIFLTIVLALILAAPNVSFAQHRSGHGGAPTPTPTPTPAPFSFGVAGDMDENTTFSSSTVNTIASQITSAGLEYFLMVGDLSYGTAGTESQICSFVTSKLGSTFPFEIVAGNHDEDGSTNGWIFNFTPCLPDKFNSTGTYGAQYYFDYGNLARVIMISPNLVLGGHSYQYLVGDSDYNWVSNIIDNARSSGIPWIIVGAHKPCLNVGDDPCDMSIDLMNLLIAKRVDLVLQGHAHNYQRSKQLTCATPGVARPECIANDGSTNTYTKGAGTIFVIDGTFGARPENITLTDPDISYFVNNFTGLNMDMTYGFMRYDVAADHISAQFIKSWGGSFSDNFTITAPLEP